MIGMFKRRYKNEKLIGFVFGGYDGNYVNDVVGYDYENDTWYGKTEIPVTNRYGTLESTTMVNKGYVFYHNLSSINYSGEFNPIFNIWAEKTGVSYYANHTAMFEINNKAYLLQGNSGTGGNYNYEYTQITDSWAVKEDFPYPDRASATAITINGKGYMIGGHTYYTPIINVDEYTQETDSWVNMTDLPEAKAYASAQTVNNKGYLFSGNNGNETFEYVNDTWSIKSDHPLPNRVQMASSKSSNGNCCIHGGNSSGELSDNDKYTVGNDTWEEKTDMIGTPKKLVSGTSINVLGSSDIIREGGYIFGGNMSSIVTSNCDKYTPSNDTWYGKTNMIQSVNYTIATTINDKAYVFCGNRNRQDCDEYSSEDDQWTMKSDMPLPRRRFAASSTINDKGYIYCGGDGYYVYEQDCDEYDPINNTWEEKTDAPNPARNRLTGFTINSKGYICCGYAGGWYRNCDEYTQITDTWTDKADYPSPSRSNLDSSVIYNKGYIYGGHSGLMCDEYDPNTNIWTNKADMLCSDLYKRDYGASTINNKGYVYCGSYSSYYRRDCIEYNSITDTWESKLDAIIVLSYLSATTLSN